MNNSKKTIRTQSPNAASPSSSGIQEHTTPDTSATSKSKKLDTVIDHAMVIARLARDSAKMSPVLGPLKGSMDILISVLEAARAAKHNKGDWIALVQRIQNQINNITERVQELEGSEDLKKLVERYRIELDGILLKMQGMIANQRKWRGIFITRENSDELHNIDRELKGCFDSFMMALNMQTHENVKDLRQGHIKGIERVEGEQKRQIAQTTTIDEISLIRSLPTASLANGDIHQYCMEGTRASILEQVKSWSLDDTAPQILWLNDVAGSGKSTVAKQVAQGWKEEGRLAGRFFFSRDAEETRTPKLFFTTVAQQGLCHISPDVRSVVAAGARKLLNPLSATLEEQCAEIFLNPLKAIDTHVILVMDALDECELHTCQHFLRVLLGRLTTSPHLKLFLTSRPETHIRRILDEFNPRELYLRSNETSNLQDVEFYMRQRLQKCPLPEGQSKRLIERAGGLFIWAKTVCGLLENIRGNRNAFIDRVLSQKLRQMDPIYRIALDQAIGHNDEEESIEAYTNVLKAIVAAYEPLSPNMINRLLGITDAMEIVNDLRSVLECPGMDDVIRFLHPTFREFLLTSQVSGRCYVDIGAAHKLMSNRCFVVMDEDLEYDICKLFQSSIGKYTPKQLEELCLQHTSATLRYACGFWGNHLTSEMVNDTIELDLVPPLERFFTVQLLNWLYMISLQGLNDKVLAMLQRLISTKSDDNIAKWCVDTLRFPKLHWNTIRASPLRVYHEFAFSPRSSIFQQIYANSTSFPHPIVTIGLPEDWTPHVVTQTYSIRASCLSPSSDVLATGGSREGVPVFSLWDVQTTDNKTLIHPCGTNRCYVCHVSFDIHGLLLRTGCNCGKLCEWNITENPIFLLVETMGKMGGSCRWWSEDGSKFVSKRLRQSDRPPEIYRTYEYDIWLVESSIVHCNILESEAIEEEEWIFSPGVSDKAINYAKESGECITMITIFECTFGHQLFAKFFIEPVTFVQFSPDSSFILLIRDYGSIELITSTSGELLWTYLWVEQVRDCQFLPNGNGIIVEGNSEINVIDPFSNSLRCREHVNSSSTRSILVSPDSKMIAGISHYGIEIFNASLNNTLDQDSINIKRPFHPHLSWKYSTLISISNQDGLTDTILFHFLSKTSHNLGNHDHSLDVSKLILSPNGHYLLTAQEDGSISLWDVRSGNKIPLDTPDGIDILMENCHIESSQDSSIALLWNQMQILVLITETSQTRYLSLPSGDHETDLPNIVPMEILACTVLPRSSQILALQSDESLFLLSVDNLNARFLQKLQIPSKVPVLQLLATSTEQLAAIVYEESLIITDFDRTVDTKFPSFGVFCLARFSPDGKRLHVVELRGIDFLVSCVDFPQLSVTPHYTATLIPTDYTDSLVGNSSLDGNWFSLMFASWGIYEGLQTLFFDALDGKPIIVASIFPENDKIQYGNYSLMTLPLTMHAQPTMAHHYIAYRHRGRSIVVDFSLLISQIRSRQDFLERKTFGNIVGYQS
ncbi:hypothetical protein CPB86DRAFT_878623 [Serendipita vermifera]|nr:hypothetical protein CPB86DRAFT_878623 [Serendipita vermifera]